MIWILLDAEECTTIDNFIYILERKEKSFGLSPNDAPFHSL